MDTAIDHIAKSDRFVNDAAAAALFGISRSGWWSGVKKKQFPQPVKIGGSTRWSVNELNAHMQRLLTGRVNA